MRGSAIQMEKTKELASGSAGAYRTARTAWSGWSQLVYYLAPKGISSLEKVEQHGS